LKQELDVEHFEQRSKKMATREAAFEVDELAASLMLVSPTPSTAKGPSSDEVDDAKARKTSDGHDRWTLVDDSTVDYGYLAKTGGSGSKDKSFYITTAINYSNGPAHIGHAYEGITSDVIARFARLCGDQSVYFVTGSDEHGQKIANTAEEAKQAPLDFCDKVRAIRFADSLIVVGDVLSISLLYNLPLLLSVCARISKLEPAHPG
jgi:tRNA synthetases class I (M)